MLTLKLSERICSNSKLQTKTHERKRENKRPNYGSLPEQCNICIEYIIAATYISRTKLTKQNIRVLFQMKIRKQIVTTLPTCKSYSKSTNKINVMNLISNAKS